MLLVIAAIGPFLVLAASPWDRPYAAKYAIPAMLPIIVAWVLGLDAMVKFLHRFAGRWLRPRAAYSCGLLWLLFLTFQSIVLFGYLRDPAKFHPTWHVSDYQLRYLMLARRARWDGIWQACW